jgi:tol-pal system protein YbgF
LKPPVADTTTARGHEIGASGVELFHAGYSEYSQGDYDRAAEAFSAFLAANPTHDLADNAQYWLGECAFAQGRYQEAHAAYRRVVEGYATGDKVAEALLKSGLCLEALGQPAAARDEFLKVTEGYPGTPPARRAAERLAALDGASRSAP